MGEADGDLSAEEESKGEPTAIKPKSKTTAPEEPALKRRRLGTSSLEEGPTMKPSKAPMGKKEALSPADPTAGVAMEMSPEEAAQLECLMQMREAAAAAWRELDALSKELLLRATVRQEYMF